MSAIIAENLTKKFGGTLVLSKVNLKVDLGESYGILGPNGAGKSTLIRLLLGLLKPSSGYVKIYGLDMKREEERVKALSKIGYIPENPSFPLQFNAFKLLCFYGRLYGLGESGLKERIIEILRVVNLKDKMSVKIGHYSRGMLKRLAIAQALLSNPEIIIMDEPTSGVSLDGVLAFKKYIKEKMNQGITIFLSTNDLEEASELCSRVGILSNGRIIGEWEYGKSGESLRDFYIRVMNIEKD